jgi:DNA-binding response OmpR family regulator
MSRKSQILIVDDEPAILMSYRTILEQSGYDVEVANNSSTAQKLMSEKPFDLLVCDLGLETSQSGLKIVLWARENLPEMACVLLTGYPDEEIFKQARDAGVHTLFKPVEVPSMLQTIDFVLRRNQ